MTDPVATRAAAWVIGSWDAHGNRPRLVSVALKKEGSRKNSIILTDTIGLTSRNLLEFPNPQAGDLVRRLPKRTGACPAGRQPYRSLREGSVCAPWQGSRPAVAFPLQTTSAKGTERHHTAPDSRWLAGGWGQGARDPTSRTGSGRDRDNTWDGIRIYRVAAAILDRSARSGMARCRLRADGESRVLASRTRSEGPPERRASKLARASRSEPATH